MGAFRNPTKKMLFDAHGREILPGQIIGVEDDLSQADPPEPAPEAGLPDGNGKTKGPAGSQPEPKGGKVSTR